MAIGSVVAAVALINLDRAVDLTPLPWIGASDAEGTRSVLSVIAGSMITVTGVVFSITVVALTLASSQFGPRILRNFIRDQTNQIAFGTFVATFLYSLFVLRAVREDQVPHIASTVAVGLAVVSLFVLIYFIHHTARSIQASTVIASVATEIADHMGHLFPESLGKAESDEETMSADELRARIAEDGKEIRATHDGYLRVLDDESLLSTAAEHDLILVIHHRPGDFVSAGTWLVRAGPSEAVTDEIASSLRDAFVLGDHRTPVQDFRFLTGQLTEIAVRALSPGVNDPRTATDCVQRLGAVVCAVSDREMPSGCRHDDAGRLRILVPSASFEEIVASCFDPIRRYGIGHVVVVIAMLEALEDASECCADPARRRVLAEHGNQIYRAFERQVDSSDRDVARVKDAYVLALSRIADRPDDHSEQ